jgi:CBS-domain-containing membrane protein
MAMVLSPSVALELFRAHIVSFQAYLQQNTLTVLLKHTPRNLDLQLQEILVKKKKTPWPESESKLNRPSDRRLSAKLVQTFADRRCHVVSVTDPYGRIVGFLVRSSYFSFK